MMEKNLINQIVNVIKSIKEENPEINLMNVVKKELGVAFSCAEFLSKAGMDLRLTDRVDFLVSTLWQMYGNEKLKRISKSLYSDEKFVSALEEVMVQYFKEGSNIKVDGPSKMDQEMINKLSKKIADYAESIPFEGDDMDFSVPVADSNGNPLEQKICEQLKKEDMVTGADGKTYCNREFHDCEGCNSPNAAEATYYRKEAKKHHIYEEAMEIVAQLRKSLGGEVYGDYCEDDSEESCAQESKEHSWYEEDMLNENTVIQLREIVKEMGLKGASRLPKAEMIQRIIEARVNEEPSNDELVYGGSTVEYVEDNLKAMTLAQLLKHCKEIGLTGVSRKPKAEVIQVILKAHADSHNEADKPSTEQEDEDPIRTEFAGYTGNGGTTSFSTVSHTEAVEETEKEEAPEVPEKKGFLGRLREIVSGMISQVLRGL